jgi:hypothetical protein
MQRCSSGNTYKGLLSSSPRSSFSCSASSYERALAMRAAQEAKKFSRITREERTPPKVKFGSVFTAVDSNLLSAPPLILSPHSVALLSLTFVPVMACNSCVLSTPTALSPPAIKPLPPPFSSPTPFMMPTRPLSVRNPSSQPSAAFFCHSLNKLLLRSELKLCIPSVGAPAVISAAIELLSVVPLHNYPPLLLAILDKVCGATAASPLALLILQVKPRATAICAHGLPN